MGKLAKTTEPTGPIEPSSAKPVPHPWWTRGDQVFVAFLVGTILVLASIHWIKLSRLGSQPVEIDRHPTRQYDYVVDVNDATWIEWMQLDGLGETLARRIVEDREQNGPFQSIDDISRVKGIGPKTLEKIRPWLAIDLDRWEKSEKWGPR